MMVVMMMIIKIVILKVVTLSPELKVITQMMKKLRCAIDDAQAKNHVFKGCLGLTLGREKCCRPVEERTVTI